MYIYFNWDSLHPKLNSHYDTWSKIKVYRKSGEKQPTFKRCLLILDLKSLRS